MTSDEEQKFDIAIIGAGIAGASAGAELAKGSQVVLLEMESQPGYHTTGRSAAVFAPVYGPAPIRALTRASAGFYGAPPKGFSEHLLLKQRDTLMIAREDQLDILDEHIADVSKQTPVSRLTGDDLIATNPLLKPGYAVAGMLDAGGSDIDVHALHQGYLRQFRDAGGTILNKLCVTGLNREGDTWVISTTGEKIYAPIVVNAAGAWADEVGQLAEAEKIGLVPKRRTALIVAAPDGVEVDNIALTADINEEFYMKPDAGRLLISPADETPSPACDAQPEELDIAICIDKIETAFDLSVRRIENKWAGLRSFVDDGCPVVGYSRTQEGFFWLAGQGGYGIQSAPALSRFAASQVLGEKAPQDILDCDFNPSDVSPKRI